MNPLDPAIYSIVFHHISSISILIQPISNLYCIFADPFVPLYLISFPHQTLSNFNLSQEILQALPDVAAFRDSLQETDLLSALEGAPENHAAGFPQKWRGRFW